MNPFEMVVIIVFLMVVGGVINNIIDDRKRKKNRSGEALKEADELRDQILELEERIQVLERIVTDFGSGSREDLRRQFRELES